MNLDLARKNITLTAAQEVIPALKFLSESGSLTDLPSVLGQLKNASPTIQRCAVVTAAALIRRNLIEHFNELAPEVRQKLSGIMESLHPHIIEEISKDIYGEDAQRRLRAVQILGLLKKNPKVRDILAELVKDRNEKIRATAVNLLSRFIDPSEQQIIMSLLNDPDKRVRANTVEALESVGNKRLIPILIRFRKDPNNRIRGNVLKALYNLGQKDVAQDICGMVSGDDDLMRATGLWVISQIGLLSPDTEELSARCLIADSEMVTRNAQNALKKINTPRALGFIRYLAPR